MSTQGNSQEDEWVETYTLQSSLDGSHWTDYYDEAGQLKVFNVNLINVVVSLWAYMAYVDSVDSTLS